MTAPPSLPSGQPGAHLSTLASFCWHPWHFRCCCCSPLLPLTLTVQTWLQLGLKTAATLDLGVSCFRTPLGCEQGRIVERLRRVPVYIAGCPCSRSCIVCQQSILDISVYSHGQRLLWAAPACNKRAFTSPLPGPVLVSDVHATRRSANTYRRPEYDHAVLDKEPHFLPSSVASDIRLRHQVPLPAPVPAAHCPALWDSMVGSGTVERDRRRPGESPLSAYSILRTANAQPNCFSFALLSTDLPCSFTALLPLPLSGKAASVSPC